MKETHDDTNRILLLVSGSSPAIITENLYAITQKTEPAFIPTEIYIITTSSGRDNIQRALLGESGHLIKLCKDYQLPSSLLSPKIHVIKNEQGEPLADIISAEDNEACANFITNIVRKVTADDNTRLHVSIAGGRKTMTYYLGYAMSVFGRIQDQMSHVLVDESYISTDFYYPPPQAVMMKTRLGEIFDASQVEIKLAQLPYLRLRDGLTESLLKDGKDENRSFSDLIALAQQQLEPIFVEVTNNTLRCGGQLIKLPDIKRAIYKWLLVRHQENQLAISFQNKEDRQNLANEFLMVYADVVGEYSGHYEKAERALKDGMDVEYFTNHRTRINNALKRVLGQSGAEPYLIESSGSRNKMRYSLPSRLSQDKIKITFR